MTNRSLPSRSLMKMVDLVRPQVPKMVSIGEALATVEKRNDYYLVCLVMLAKKNRLLLRLSGLTLIAEGADPLSIVNAVEILERQVDGSWVRVQNEETTLRSIDDAVEQLSQIAAETVASGEIAVSVNERVSHYLRLMSVLAGNIRFRLFLVCSTLLSLGADKLSVDEAAKAYSDQTRLE